jgi:DNA mismatch endonuclease (patch repair protein)
MDGNVWSPPKGYWASDEATRKKMLGNRSRDTKPEMLVRSLVHRRGLRYRVSARPVPEIRRTADLVFRPTRVAVFIDGCYWHGCEQHYKEPKTNVEYWREKIDRNKRRDRETDDLLAAEGWSILRFWAHDDPETVAAAIERAVRLALGHSPAIATSSPRDETMGSSESTNRTTLQTPTGPVP